MEETEKTYTAWGLDEGEHEAQGLKPMLTPEGQVELLKAKGVTFDRCSEEQAIEALSGRDTFLHTRRVPEVVPGSPRRRQGGPIRQAGFRRLA